jgi:hypothetical protein
MTPTSPLLDLQSGSLLEDKPRPPITWICMTLGITLMAVLYVQSLFINLRTELQAERMNSLDMLGLMELQILQQSRQVERMAASLAHQQDTKAVARLAAEVRDLRFALAEQQSELRTQLHIEMAALQDRIKLLEDESTLGKDQQVSMLPTMLDIVNHMDVDM